MYLSSSVGGKFGTKLTDFSQIFAVFAILAQIWREFEKQPIHVPNFVFYEKSLYQMADFCNMWHIPR